VYPAFFRNDWPAKAILLNRHAPATGLGASANTAFAIILPASMEVSCARIIGACGNDRLQFVDCPGSHDRHRRLALSPNICREKIAKIVIQNQAAGPHYASEFFEQV